MDGKYRNIISLFIFIEKINMNISIDVIAII